MAGPGPFFEYNGEHYSEYVFNKKKPKPNTNKTKTNKKPQKPQTNNLVLN